MQGTSRERSSQLQSLLDMSLKISIIRFMLFYYNENRHVPTLAQSLSHSPVNYRSDCLTKL